MYDAKIVARSLCCNHEVNGLHLERGTAHVSEGLSPDLDLTCIGHIDLMQSTNLVTMHHLQKSRECCVDYGESEALEYIQPRAI